MLVEMASKADVAGALRAAGHLFIESDLSEKQLHALSEAVGVMSDILRAAPTRTRSTETFLTEIPAEPPPDGSSIDHYVGCPVSGRENPLGLAATVSRDGDDVVASVVFGAAFAGVPGVCHGGPVSSVFDDVMGFVFTTMNGRTGYTATMTVDFKAPVRIGSRIEFRGRLVRQEGRKFFIEAEAVDPDRVLLARASALFLEVEIASLRSALNG